MITREQLESVEDPKKQFEIAMLYLHLHGMMYYEVDFNFLKYIVNITNSIRDNMRYDAYKDNYFLIEQADECFDRFSGKKTEEEKKPETKFKVGDKIENRFSSHRVYDIIGIDLDNQEYHCKHSYCNSEEDLPFECADKDYELYDDTPTPPDYGDEVRFEPKIYDSVFYYNKGEIKTGKIVGYRADEGIYELDNDVELLPNEIIGIGK